MEQGTVYTNSQIFEHKMKCAVILLALIVGSQASLHDDFQDILNVIPLEKIQKIAEQHSAHDAEYREVVQYMHGKEWNNMLNQVDKEAAYKTLRNYLYQIGLDIQKIINFIKHIFDGSNKRKVKDTVLSQAIDEENLRAFLDEVEAIIPGQKLLAVILDKLKNSPDFQKFYQDISGTRTHKLVDQTLKLPALEKLIKKLEGMGARVNDAIAVLYAILGWEIPKH